MTGSSSSLSSGQTSISKYSKVLPVSIRKENFFQSSSSNGNISPSQGLMQSSPAEQRELVRVTLIYPSPSYGSMNPHKEIILRLTNDDNPLFYYHLRVTEGEFPTLKSQQGLLIDFYGFPGQLVSLLDKCDPNLGAHDGDGYMRSKSCDGSGPKFVLVLKINGGITVLDIVESNPFKYLCHLSLEISPGTDAEVKKFLCDVTTSLKKDHLLLQEKYNHLASTMEVEMSRLKALFENKCTELNQLREEVHSQTSSMTSKHFHELAEEKDRLLKLQSEMVNKFDQDRSEAEKQNKQIQKNLQNRVAALEAENQSLSLVKANQESALQDASNRLRICGDELKKFQQELATLRQQNTKIDYDYHQMRLAKMECQREVQSLDKVVKKHEDTIQKQQSNIIELSCEKKKLEEQKVDIVKEMEKLRCSSISTASELVKANEIIKKLQDDIRNCHAKNKQHNVAIVETERKLKEKEKLVQDLQEQETEHKQELKATQDELSTSRSQLAELQSKITDFEATVESNENMISWLNKQLNELQGLSDLNRFRSNLSQQPEAPNQTEVQRLVTVPRNPSVSNKNASGRHGLSKTLGEIQNTSAQPFNNTVGGGSPSWLHIYQSTTGNQTERDLSSRLEHVSALGAILNSQNKGAPKDSSSRNSPEEPVVVPSENNGIIDKTVKSNKTNSRPPTWAKSKSKVTLDTMLNKPTFPIWKNK